MKTLLRYLVITAVLLATILSVWACNGKDGEDTTTAAADETTTAADDETTVEETTAEEETTAAQA